MEIQTNGDERHEVEADGTEKESNSLVDEPHNMESPVSIFAWVLVSELRDFKLHSITRGNFVVDKWTVVEARNIHNGCEWHILVDDTKNVTHAWQNEHDVDFDDETDDSLE